MSISLADLTAAALILLGTRLTPPPPPPAVPLLLLAVLEPPTADFFLLPALSDNTLETVTPGNEDFALVTEVDGAFLYTFSMAKVEALFIPAAPALLLLAEEDNNFGLITFGLVT